MADESTQKLLHVIIAILLPPVAVWLKEGVGIPLALNVVLTIAFWIPGVLHALYLLLMK